MPIAIEGRTVRETRTADEVMSNVLCLPKMELPSDGSLAGAWFLTPIEAWMLVEEVQRLRARLSTAIAA